VSELLPADQQRVIFKIAVDRFGYRTEAARQSRAVLAAVADKPDQQSFAAGVRNNLATVLFGLKLKRRSTTPRRQI
jgi:hypothetical protein